MEHQVKFRVIIKGKIVGIERLNGAQWQWMYYDLNPDNGERWNNGVFGNTSDLKRDQFSTVLDKNGKEVYEGDVVNCTRKGFVSGNFENVHAIVGRDPWQNLIATPIKKDGDENELDRQHFAHYRFGSIIYPSNIEVIGNIHEHPELLT